MNLHDNCQKQKSGKNKSMFFLRQPEKNNVRWTLNVRWLEEIFLEYGVYFQGKTSISDGIADNGNMII